MRRFNVLPTDRCDVNDTDASHSDIAGANEVVNFIAGGMWVCIF